MIEVIEFDFRLTIKHGSVGAAMSHVDSAIVGVICRPGPPAPRLDLERVCAQEPRHGPRSDPYSQRRQP